MNIDYITFSLYIRELAENISGTPLQKIFQAGEGEFILRFRKPGDNYFLLISMKPGYEAIHPVPRKFSSGILPSPFCMALRKHLEGARVTEVTRHNNDRVMHIRFKRTEEDKILAVELTGRNANIILMDSQLRCITAYNRKDPSRDLRTGQTYQSPPLPPGFNPLSEKEPILADILKTGDNNSTILNTLHSSFPAVPGDYLREILLKSGIQEKTPLHGLDASSLETLQIEWNKFFACIKARILEPVLYYRKDDPNMEGKPLSWTPWPFEILKDNPREQLPDIGALLQGFFFTSAESRPLEELKKEMTSALKKRIKKVSLRIEKQEKDLEGTKRADTLKRWGDLLLANRAGLPDKYSFVEVEDYYCDPPAPVKIPLNPALSISDNAMDLYNRFKKAKRGRDIVKERLELSGSELAYLEELLYEIESATEISELDDLAAVLDAEGIYTRPDRRSSAKSEEASGPRKFTLDQGYVALVGRNSRQNDEITLRQSGKEDLWFHARQIPGSHVVLKIRKPSNPVPDKVIYKAAQLAAFFSKGKTGSKVPVDYTRIKNVRKTKGQKPGQVFYTHEKTIITKPELPA